MVLGDLDVFLWFHDIGFGSSELCVGKFGIGLDELIGMSMVLEGQQMNRGRRQRRKPYNLDPSLLSRIFSTLDLIGE